MLAAPWSETIRETPKVLLVYLIEDCDHSLLNNLVLQSRDPERPLPTARFRNVHSPRWLRSISAPVDPAVQISELTLQPGLILQPRDSVHPWGGFSLQGVKAVPEQLHRLPVQHSSEQGVDLPAGDDDHP